MKRGVGLAAGFGLISVVISLGVSMTLQKKQLEEITPQMADQYKAADEISAMNMGTAVESFVRENSRTPQAPEELIPKYLDSIPREAFSKLTRTVAVYDGTGGWVYDAAAGAFKPNHPQTANVK